MEDKTTLTVGKTYHIDKRGNIAIYPGVDPNESCVVLFQPIVNTNYVVDRLGRIPLLNNNKSHYVLKED